MLSFAEQKSGMSVIALWRRCPERMRKFFQFVIVGGVNTCFGYLVYALVIWAGFSPPIAVLIAMIVGPIFNFFSFGRMVFKQFNLKRLPQFVLVYIANYLGNVFLLGKLQKVIPSPYLAQLLILPLSAVFMFLALSRFVFDRRT